MTRIAIYPGTFDPIQFGHIDLATRAATMFDLLVFAIYDRPDKRLLFSAAHRAGLASEALKDTPNIQVTAYSGLTVEFARQVGAKTIVRGLRVIPDFELEYQMALTNRQLAPEIETICLMTRQEHTFLSSTIVKQIALLGGDVSGMVPPHVEAALRAKREERQSYEEFV